MFYSRQLSLVRHPIMLNDFLWVSQSINLIAESFMLNHRTEMRNEEASVYPVDSNNKRNVVEKTVPTSTPIVAVIGPKIQFKGELVGEEDLLIQGQFDGTIDLKGHNLIVGEQGKLNANASAKTINVQGRVEGDLFGEERIAIRSSSFVQGNIKADRVVLEDGAKFKGSIDMDMGEPQAKPLLPTTGMGPSEKASKKPDQ